MSCFSDTWYSDVDFQCHKVPNGDLDCELAVDFDAYIDEPNLKCCSRSERSECNKKHPLVQFTVAGSRCNFECDETKECPDQCAVNPFGQFFIANCNLDCNVTLEDCKRLCEIIN